MVTHLQNLDYFATIIYVLLIVRFGLSFEWFIMDGKFLSVIQKKNLINLKFFWCRSFSSQLK